MIDGLHDFMIVFLTAMKHGKLAPGIAQNNAMDAGVGLVAEDIFPGSVEGFLRLGDEANACITRFFGSHSSQNKEDIDDAAFFAGSCLKGKLNAFAVDDESGFKAVSIEDP